MKGLIIYKSKYGATTQYADWLGADLGLPVCSIEKADSQELQAADYVLIGSSVYIGRLLIKKWLRKNMAILKNKKLFLFVVCGGGATDKQQQEAIINTNLPEILRKQCDVYFMPGRLDIKNCPGQINGSLGLVQHWKKIRLKKMLCATAWMQ